MAYTDIDKPSDYFETKLYTGNDANDREISLGLTPDLTWIKARSAAYGHSLFDRIRGLGYSLSSNTTAANRNVGSEFSWSNSGCTTNSFTVDRGSNESLNENAKTMVAWNWKANGSGSLNEVGSIDSTVSANTTAGFSIVKIVKNNTTAHTVGHGLGSVPKMIIGKSMTGGSYRWIVYHQAIGNTHAQYLNENFVNTDSVTFWNDTSPTSSVFSLGTDNSWNGTTIFYCFAEKQGYSKFGSYTGNGSTDGTFVYTGMRPAFVMIKRTDSTSSWSMRDTARSTFNVVTNRVWSDLSNAESTSTTETIDILSNGFKCRNNVAGINTSGATYIYMAFAENPFVTSTGVPATAR